jgi:hypothetical protein
LIIATVFIIEIPKDVSAQGTEEWIALHNGPKNFIDDAHDIAIGPSGTIYITGTCWGIGTNRDCDTVAYDQDGNELWSARYDGPGIYDDKMFAIAVDSSENIFVTGTSHSNISSNDYITIAYDSMGNELWLARYDGPYNFGDTAWAIATDSSGFIYVTGESRGVGVGGDYATVKYDSSGNEIWVARWSGPGYGVCEGAKAITVDSLGNVYVTGIGHYGDTRWDYATIKYDSMGNEIWVARYSGFEHSVEGGCAIALDSLGKVYVTGESGTVAYDQFGNQIWVKDGHHGNGITLDSLNNVYVTGYTNSDESLLGIITVKYDSDGNELWSVGYKALGNVHDEAYDIALDQFGNVYVTGCCCQSNQSFYDFITLAYDSDGNELWMALYNGPGDNHDYARKLAIDSSGDIYVTGSSCQITYMSSYTTIKYSGQGNPPILNSTINIDPNTLNLKSKGRWITAYISLPEGYSINDIDISSILLEGTIPAEWGDIQGDTLMVKFDRSEVEDILVPGTYNLKVTGELLDGSGFEGFSDEVRVIDPGK